MEGDKTNIYWLLSPIHYLLKGVGIISFKCNDNTSRKKSFISKILTVLIVMLHVTSCVLVTLLYLSVQSKLQNMSVLISVGFRVYIAAESIFILWSGIYLKIRNAKVVLLIKELQRIEEKLREYEIRLNYKKMRRAIIAMEITFVILLNLLMFVGSSLQSDVSYLRRFILAALAFFAFITPGIVTLAYYVIFFILGEMLEKLNDKFDELSKLYDVGDIFKTIVRFATVHQEISNYVLEIGKFSGLFLLISFLRNFALITIQFFGFILTIINNIIIGFNMGLMFFVMITHAICCIYFYIHVGNKCITEWKRSKRIMFNLVVERREKIVRQEVMAFSLQLFHERPVIAPWGFFIIDSNLTLAMTAAIAMYTIVLIQFDMKLDLAGTFLNSTRLSDGF